MARKVRVDMTGVESFTKCAEGDHIVKLKKIEEATANSSGADMLSAVFEVTKGESKGANVFENFVLSEKALWKLKGFLEAIGVKADGKIALDLDKLVGKICIISVSHEEYNGQMRARIQEYRKLESSKSKDEDYDEDDEDIDIEEDDEEETPPPAKTKKDKKNKKKPAAPEKASKPAPPAKGKKKPEPEPEEDDEDYDDDDDDEDEWDEE